MLFYKQYFFNSSNLILTITDIISKFGQWGKLFWSFFQALFTGKATGLCVFFSILFSLLLLLLAILNKDVIMILLLAK